MTADKISYKNKLKQFAQSILEQRIAAIKTIITEVQQSANNEEKSSAGDKYETGRAMGQLEREMQSKQLGEYVKELTALHIVDTNKNYTSITPGAFADCGTHAFFIAIGLGKQLVDEKIIYFLSPQAPMTKFLQNKKPGDQFPFNGVELIIKDVY